MFPMSVNLQPLVSMIQTQSLAFVGKAAPLLADLK
jgi:hypothetical protein